MLRVDKDVKLMRDYFGLNDPYSDMSPLVLPRGYTKVTIKTPAANVLNACKIYPFLDQQSVRSLLASSHFPGFLTSRAPRLFAQPGLY
jgi:hypothetical protein